MHDGTRCTDVKATSLKEQLIELCPCIKDAASFREARHVFEDLGGSATLKEELIQTGFLDPNTNLLTTGAKPLNIFARCASGCLSQGSQTEAEQSYLEEYKDQFMVCSNLPENDEHWRSDDPQWVGKASMSQRHRFLTTRNLHWQWFNVLTFGLVPKEDGGVTLQEALEQLKLMRTAAMTFATRAPDWSGGVGLFVHVFGHNSVNSLHIHIVDLATVGPTFWKFQYKNCPLDAVIAALEDELSENATLCEVLTINVGGSVVATQRATLRLAPSASPLRKLVEGISPNDSSLFGPDGQIFLDYPPGPFQMILDRLRMLRLNKATRSVLSKRWPGHDREDVRDLARSLGLESLLFPTEGSSLALSHA